MGGHQWCLPYSSVLTVVLSEADIQTSVHGFAKKRSAQPRRLKIQILKSVSACLKSPDRSNSRVFEQTGGMPINVYGA